MLSQRLICSKPNRPEAAPLCRLGELNEQQVSGGDGSNPNGYNEVGCLNVRYPRCSPKSSHSAVGSQFDERRDSAAAQSWESSKISVCANQIACPNKAQTAATL